MPGRTVAARRKKPVLVAVVVAAATLVFLPAQAMAVELCAGLEATITGTEDADTLDGTSGPDVIVGLGGDDIINGLGGDDVICGGNGDDTILGGWGSDDIRGEDGNDTIDGQGAGDEIDGGKGMDILAGGGGGDLVIGGGGNDDITGGKGNDDLRGGYGIDTIDGGDGNDVIAGGTADDVLLGGNGADDLKGNAGNDLLKGQAGNDSLDGGNQDDELRGGNGNDDIRGGAGDDVGYGAAGEDQLRGGNDDDVLFGGTEDDVLSGFGGVDTVNGGPGSDDCLAETEIACEGGLIDFAFERFYINQAVPAADSYDAPANRVEPVADRPGIVRGFFSATRFDSGYKPDVVLHWKKTGGETGEVVLDGPNSPKVLVKESKLGDTHNHVFDETFLEEGMQFYIEIDPGDGYIELAENNNRYPASGWLDPGVVAVPTLEITFVPIGLDGGQAPDIDENSALALLEDTIDLHPISDVDIAIHDAINYNTLGTFQDWEEMLEDVAILGLSEDPTRAYAGIVPTDPAGVGVAGIGYINQPGFTFLPYSVNRPIPSTIAHELGHNFSQYHVQACGEGGPWEPYPYPAGNIGSWGYEADTGLLKDPSQFKDLMTYCNPEWTSDYTYGEILDYRTSGSGFEVVAVPAGTTPMVFTGSIGTGATSVRIPEFGDPQASLAANAADMSSIPVFRNGTNRLVGLDAAGRVVTSAFFSTAEVADTLDLTHAHRFAFALAVDDTDLARIVRWEVRDALGLVAADAGP